MDEPQPGVSRVHNIAADERHLLHNRWAVVQKLRVLAKKPVLVTAHFNAGRDFVLTSVVDVLADENLLLLDYGADEPTNQRLLGSERVIFTARHEGIAVQFSSSGLRRARYQGQTVFACALPETLLWRQRRESFRVKVPANLPVSCSLQLGESKVQVPVIDISVGGIALLDTTSHQALCLDAWLPGCALVLPETNALAVDLRVRHAVPLNRQDPGAGQHVGCAFGALSHDTSVLIQRYIFAVDAQSKQVRDE